MKILLVEDDEALITVLTKSLVAHNYVVDTVKDGEMGWNYGSTFEYDLMVLDIMLPKLDGISLCQHFRAEGYTTPILLLTSQDTSTAKVRGFDAGADDYVVKPFDRLELIARIRALLRRSSVNPFPLLTWGDLLLNPSTCEVTYDGQPLCLTAKEYRLLELLLWDSQHVFSTGEILDRLWSSEEFPAEATVRSHIRRLRHKLVAVGASPDFIATMPGRGYYLKAPNQEAKIQGNGELGTCTERMLKQASKSVFDRSSRSMGNTPCVSSTERHPEQQAKYLAFLNETWAVSRPKSLEQLTVLSQTVKDLQADSLDHQLQAHAQQTAHKLAGTLGTFGLIKGMQLARQLENLLESHKLLQPQQAVLLETLVNALKREIQDNTLIPGLQSPSEHSPLLLIVGQDSHFTQSLVTVASNRGINTAIAPTIEMARTWLNSRLIPEYGSQFPQAMLLLLAPQTQATNFLEYLQNLTQSYTDLPILVVGDRSDFINRLEIVRRGGKILLEPSIAPEDAIAAVTQLLSGSVLEPKVMIVDDDRDWLHTLPSLLNPWGFKVTTLAEPQQFWTVLQAVIPDVLVLDVNMPQINGLELCQVLRSDVCWRRLPVLFVSALTDATTQNQAFTLGADDYLCKPVMGIDLANRIRNRLQRARTWAS